MFANNNLIKNNNILLLMLLTVITVSVRSGNNTYIQFFSDIIDNLKISGEDANYIIRLNIIGVLVVSCIAGPFADIYGRRKLFIFGLILYMLSSIACYYFINDSFTILLIGRFSQGISEGIITIVGWLILFDRFSITESGKMSGFIKGMSAFVLALIPLFILWIANIYYWRIAFITIPILSIIALLLALISIKKEEIKIKKHPNLIKNILKEYWTLLRNFECITYTLIYAFASATYVVFFSNASIVFIQHNHISKEMFSYFIVINSMAYILFSFLSIYIIGKKGIDYTKNMGFIVFIIGCVGLFISTHIDAHDIDIILPFVLIISSGSALMTGFILKSVDIFPHMKGAIMSLNFMLVSAMSARKIYWTQVFYDDTIIPTSTVIFIGATILTILFSIVSYKKFKAQ